MGHAKPYEIEAARKMWESGDYTYPQIGAKFGKSKHTIVEWRKKYGWGPKGSVPTVQPSEPVVEVEAEVVPTPAEGTTLVADESLAELEHELEELRARNAALQEENDKFKPTYDVRGLLNHPVETLSEFFGPDYWRELAEQEFASENRQRMRDGLRPMDPDDRTISDIIVRIQQEKRDQPNRIPGSNIAEPAMKKIKMVIHRPMVFRGRTIKYPVIEQIPLEPQINNTAGSLADGIVRYTEKGFKLTDPFLCPRNGCMADAALDNMNWAFSGYCSRVHQMETEGVTNRDTNQVIVSSGAYAAG